MAITQWENEPLKYYLSERYAPNRRQRWSAIVDRIKADPKEVESYIWNQKITDYFRVNDYIYVFGDNEEAMAFFLKFG